MLRALFRQLSKAFAPHADCSREDTFAWMHDPVAIIGDVHGRDDLFVRMVDKIALHPASAKMRVVLVGDLIDRGPESAAALRRAHALCKHPAPFADVTALMGNHERMALDFLRDPLENAPRWWAAGGEATVASFGLGLPYTRQTALEGANQIINLRDALLERMGPELVDWLDALPLFWREDAVFVAHAGADPGLPLQGQGEAALLWGRYRPAPGPRTDGIRVVQGHLIQKEPRIEQGRLLIDTGAWKTGHLSAVILSQNAPEILAVSDTS